LARRTFDVIDIVEILIHWYAGRSQNELAASLGVDRKTLRKYLAPAREAGMEPGGPPMAEADWRALVTGWFPGLVDATRLRQSSWPGIRRLDVGMHCRRRRRVGRWCGSRTGNAGSL
jgi:hypothetical protein